MASKTPKPRKKRLHQFQQIAGGPGWAGSMCGRCGVCKRVEGKKIQHAPTWGAPWIEGAPPEECEDITK